MIVAPRQAAIPAIEAADVPNSVWNCHACGETQRMSSNSRRSLHEQATSLLCADQVRPHALAAMPCWMQTTSFWIPCAN